ncbi:hypothetical protein B9T11_07935 [Wohlfahrtiimonas chitiniclastica]|uniref:hypothetical protein n=1 Tax=Wohlfahrtiimonas chitiniclastica TaxID=400946 RepID=UPI000B97E690|nr:hypothetical protein [Wohlfahrtiimonas chitiniclastica]MBS7818673.1 hypothetical protein [Wohlfahrtiimonas chitiniclastica]MBS7827019.1 hypothetical protein [Wohlfahrtiimonas chitiniclastica]OYQ79157.1 hypothetical protein B9T11_07935 [Wohlfahrtiimonas chitiniclastica]
MGIAIGIDCGVNTGFAISQNQKLIVVTSYSILDAMDMCLEYQDKDPILYIEDARKLRWGGYNKGNTARLQGAGSVKRDSQIWEDFAKKHGFRYMLVSPKSNAKKLDAEQFNQLTGWIGQTNNHGRDAAMLVWGR